MPKCFHNNAFNCSGIEPSNIPKLLLNTRGVTLPNDFNNIFQSLLMLYYIIKPSKSICFVSIMQSTPESSIATRVQTDFYILMKHGPPIILKLLINLSDSYKIYSYKKECTVFILHRIHMGIVKCELVETKPFYTQIIGLVDEPIDIHGCRHPELRDR